jgi:hypothetical protein
VRRLLVSSACAAAAVDQAMTAHLRATVAPAEDQPDLFINRGMRARAMSGRRLEAIDGDAEARRRADDDQDLSVGPPVLEMFVRLPR